MNVIIHTDGGSRGNPGPAAVGIVIDAEVPGKEPHRGPVTKRLVAFGKRIGVTTNNVAEYTAVIEALTYVLARTGEGEWKEGIDRIDFYLDSALVVNQLNGIFKIKHPGMRQLLTEVRLLEADSKVNVYYHAIPREQNMDADAEVNAALDSQ